MRALLLVGATILSGCATQVALVDVQTDVELIRGRVDRLGQRVDRATETIQDRTSTGTQSQVDLVVRLDQLVADLQTVQGRLEEQAYAVSQMARSLDDQSYQFNQVSARLEALESWVTDKERRARGQAPSGPSAPWPANSGGVTAPSAAPPTPEQAGVETTRERVVLPGRTPRSDVSPVEAYNLAYNDYVKGSYALAIQGFQAFLSQFPSSILAPHALYWLGESYYQTTQYSDAVATYKRLTAQYPKNEKLPGALLKEAFAYAEMGDKGNARVALKRVVEEYPHASEANLAKQKLAELR